MLEPNTPDTIFERLSRPRARWLELAIIAVVALSLNLAGNGRASLWDRDEPRYAGCTREMRERGDWILPTFNGEPRYHKPVLIYWLMRFGFAVGGDNPFGARLVSSIAGMGTCLVVLGLGRRMFGPRIGFLAALMYTTAPIVVVESKLATTDATLSLFLIGAQFLLWELRQRPSKRLAAAFWGLLGLATLTKGPVGPALIVAAGLTTRLLGGPSALVRNLDWKRGPLCFFAVTAPWFIAVAWQSNGDFYRYAIGKQIGERLLTKMEEHGGFPGYYVLTSILTFHPWSALIPAALYAAWKRKYDDSRMAFLLGWTIGPLILLECVRTKLVHYYLPAYPAWAFLSAWLVDAIAVEGVNLRRRALGRLAIGLLGGVGIGASCALAAGGFVLPGSIGMPCLVIAVCVAIGTVWAIRQFQQKEGIKAVGGLAITWALVMAIVGAWLAPSFEPYRTSHIVGKRLATLSTKHRSEPILLSFQEPTIIYSMGRTATEVRTWERVDELLEEHRTLAAAINTFELKAIQKRPHLEVEIVETLKAFNLSKGSSETLNLGLIRRKPRPLIDNELQLSRGGVQETLVK